MKNKKTKKTQIGLIALAFLFLPNLPVQAASNDILVYAMNSQYGLEIAKTELETAGFKITTTYRTKTNEITDSMLSNYGQIWIIDSCVKIYGRISFSNDEINAIKNFQENGGGLLLSVDNDNCQEGVNPITKKFNDGADLFYGKFKQGGQQCITPELTWTGHNTIHPVWQDVSTVSSTNSDAYLNIKNSNIKVTAKVNNVDYGAVLDDGKGKVVFDTSFARFTEHRCSSHKDETYQLNIANWLGEGKASCLISASPSSIASGQSSILTWSSKGADSVTPFGFTVSALSGSASVSPRATTTYKLTVQNGKGQTASCETTVTVKEPSKPLPVISGPCQNLVPCKDDCKLSDIFVMIQNIVNCLVFISTIICLLFLVIGGLLYIFSLGNPENLTKAKNTILWALGGLALVFLAWLIVNTVMQFMGVGGGFLMWSSVG